MVRFSGGTWYRLGKVVVVVVLVTAIVMFGQMVREKLHHLEVHFPTAAVLTAVAFAVVLVIGFVLTLPPPPPSPLLAALAARLGSPPAAVGSAASTTAAYPT